MTLVSSDQLFNRRLRLYQKFLILNFSAKRVLFKIFKTASPDIISDCELLLLLYVCADVYAALSGEKSCIYYRHQQKTPNALGSNNIFRFSNFGSLVSPLCDPAVIMWRGRASNVSACYSVYHVYLTNWTRHLITRRLAAT